MSYIGKTIDRYKFLSLIGKGSFGEVYKAYDERLLRKVAIKVSFPEVGKDINERSNLIREAQIIARAEHPNIVPIYDLIDDSQSVLIVMRLVNGLDLGEIMKRRGNPYEIYEAYRLMKEVCAGMDYAHRTGIVHSDLKPGNVIVDGKNAITILDFSLAAMLEINQPEKGHLYGTPSYMSPEQIEGKFHDSRSDIYALGMILYKMITGHHPFEQVESMQQMIEYQLNQIPDRPELHNPHIPVAFSDAIMKALEKEPEHRFTNCMQLLDTLTSSVPDEELAVDTNIRERWDPRLSVVLKARILLHQQDGEIPVEVINLSVTGAKLILPVNLDPGTVFQLELELPEDGKTFSISTSTTVIWVEVHANDRYQIGVKLDGLSDKEKQTISRFIRNEFLSENSFS